jgi:ATP-dependent DNA helicase DinG
MLDLCRDTRLADIAEKSGVRGIENRIDELEKLAKECRLAMGTSVSKGSWSQLEERPGFNNALQALKQGLLQTLEILELAAAKGDLLENCHQRTQSIVDRLASMERHNNEEFILWYETSKTGFRFHNTPLNIADKFRELVCEQDRSIIFTSATLAVSGSFAHYQQQLGLENASTDVWPGPFNYAEQALFYLPQDLPEPNDQSHTTKIVELAEELIKISRGRAFLLFTSFRALNEAASLLKDRLDYPLLVQGEAPRHELLQHFRSTGDAVLLGTGSFWEGVDVKGDALSLVIIDKLPFAAPDDPVLQARSRAVRGAGLNPFMTLQLPQAVVALRQGAGRLIRSVDDRGVFVLCDVRLVSKSYGKIFTRSLPPMKRTRDFNEVSTFLEMN